MAGEWVGPLGVLLAVAAVAVTWAVHYIHRARRPAPHPTGGPRSAWYPDPAGTGRLRWFDGTDWTEHYAARTGGMPDPGAAT